MAALAPAAGTAEASTEKTDSSASPPVAAPVVSVASSPGERLRVSLSATEEDAVLRFPFSERMAAAVFRHSHYVWIVLHKPLTLDLSDFDELPKTIIGKPEVLPSATATILRFPLDDTISMSVSKEDNSFNWAVLLTARHRLPASPLKVAVNTDPPAPPNVFIQTLEMADPVTATDPLVGDALIIVPLFNNNEGMTLARDFVDFSLPETAQGIVVAKKADEVTVSELRNGARITLPQGANLSPGLPEPDIAHPPSASLTHATLFSYNAWKADRPFFLQLHQLFTKIAASHNVPEANEMRLRRAQIYLSDGMGSEALGELENIKRLDAPYYRSAKLAAVRAAAEFLMYRFADAGRDFSASELNNNKEIDYWRTVLADLQGDPDQPNDYLGMNTDYISKYPPILRQRLAIVAADRAIANKDYNTALKIFDTLQKDNQFDSIKSYINFLLAKISDQTGQEKDAADMFDKLSDDYKHPFVSANAEYTRVVSGLDNGSINKDTAIDRLERLRLAWHGDTLELNMLSLLGSLYEGRKDYVNAMRVWNDGVTGFPSTALAVDMNHKMQEAFVIMFNEGLADKLPPLDALAIYYQYRNFMPTGPMGNDMIERLGDRLIAVDLLDQAASLLDHHMRTETEKQARSRIGARLATIYLLNHQPQKALHVLEDSMYGENPLLLRLYRNRLTAQAMLDMGNLDKVMLTLGQDDSADAERIRLEVYWRQKDWPHVITNVEGVLKARKDITAPVTLEESEPLLKLALAYVFENNTVQLQYLHDYFGPLMADNPNKPVFDFITRTDITPTTTNFDEVIKNLSDTRSFIDNYKAHIKVSGLKEVVK